ncbi:hypothetical protein TDB9533_01845 [Thalassocella blandensis]|nr:hypothetical protein TDB9533_01845 [Thalassocella blandensis]
MHGPIHRTIADPLRSDVSALPLLSGLLISGLLISGLLISGLLISGLLIFSLLIFPLGHSIDFYDQIFTFRAPQRYKRYSARRFIHQTDNELYRLRHPTRRIGIRSIQLIDIKEKSPVRLSFAVKTEVRSGSSREHWRMRMAKALIYMPDENDFKIFFTLCLKLFEYTGTVYSNRHSS